MVRCLPVVRLAASISLLAILTPSAARADEPQGVARGAMATLEVNAEEPTAVTIASPVQTLGGTTPLTLSLPPGSYVVRRAATETSTRIVFDLAAGDHRRVELPAEPRSSSVFIWVALGVGAVALGATLGVVAFSQR